MKKMINIAFAYGVAGLVAGAFYRELTKFVGFTGQTTLSIMHTHLFAMGMIVTLIVALFYKQYALEGNKKFNTFFKLYHLSLPVVVLTMFIRGMFQALEIPLSKALSASISGVSGIAHIMITVALVLFFLSLKEEIAKEEVIA